MLLALDGEFIIQNAISALAFGSLFALFALGIALIFGVMQLINFAHGELIMAGGFAIYLLADRSLAEKVLVVLAVVTAFALAAERVAFRPVRGASPATLLVTSFGLSFLLQNVAYMTFGAIPKSARVWPELTKSINIGEVSFSRLDVLIVVVTAFLLVALILFLARTRVGVQMRASAEDFRMARILGVRANTVIAAAFAISGFLAGIAALLFVTKTGAVTTTMGVYPVLIAFVATIVGGMGSLTGAVLGGFLLGGLTVGLDAGLPFELRPYRDAFVYSAVFAILIARPTGIIAVRSREQRV